MNSFLTSCYINLSHLLEGVGRAVGRAVLAVHWEQSNGLCPGMTYSSILLASIQSLQLLNFLFPETYLLLTVPSLFEFLHIRKLFNSTDKHWYIYIYINLLISVMMKLKLL